MSKEEKKKKGWVKWLVAIVSGLVTGAIIAVVFIAVKNNSEKKAGAMKSDVESEYDASSADYSDDMERTNGAENVSKSMKVSSSDVSEIVDSVLPSVVSVECISERTYDLYSELFGFDFGDDSFKQKAEVKSTGSGFIIGQNGKELLIATNNHVVEGAKEVSVEFIDGTKADATVKGTDSFYDVAVLSVMLSEFSDETIDKIKIATIGNSDDMQVGSMVICIGNALGYGQSVTVGYVGALNREVKMSDGRTTKLLQTDATINHGNSGGPLLNIYGEVVGIASAKYATNSTTGKTEGMGFAIPITKVVPIINELMNRVELSESEIGYLGIEGKEVSDSYAKVFGMPKGLYVYSVVKGSAADTAGILEGDIITQINGRSISSMDDLKKSLQYKKYDTEVDVTYSTMGRTGYEEKTITVKLGKKSIFDRSDNN